MSLKLVDGKWVGSTGGVNLEDLEKAATVTKSKRCTFPVCTESSLDYESPYVKAVNRSLIANRGTARPFEDIYADVKFLFTLWNCGEACEKETLLAYMELA